MPGDNHKQHLTLGPALYGLVKSNRQGDDLWGKNQFNSTFPTALACWMRDKELSPVYLSLAPDTHNQQETTITPGIIPFNDVFRSTRPNEALTFLFETSFAPFRGYVHDTLDHIDLIIKDESLPDDRQWLRPLEVKLTVLPDSSTCNDPDENNWGSELVIRPDSTSYAALGIFNSLKDQRTAGRAIIEPAAIEIADWQNPHEILTHKSLILNTLDRFLASFATYQQPFLMQPVWKTQGKNPSLHDQAFDIFLWSDFALCHVFIDQARSETKNKVSRFLRASARLLRCLNDLLTTEKTHVARIFRGMELGNQTDKEFSLNGAQLNKYMMCERLKKPCVPKEALTQIILNGGEEKLSPERRFDATIYFTARHLFETSAQQ